ncbi:MarR family winged helix-turn-helix transcriptional regulator [Kitasatospora cineracea]|uniref:MarR family winged helix-turn-helix transcriptional regulator n=1 Tax=Kitasatospora cineracea TaxID=88074 RepID=UPI003404A4B8
MAKFEAGPMNLVTALVRTSFLVDAAYTRAGREHGLTPQQGQLLCVLTARPYGMSELSAALGLAKSSLTGLVDRTERHGLVRREGDPNDCRAVRVTLTERGGELAERFYAAACRRIDGLPSGLDAEQRGTLTALLERVVLDNEAPEVFTEPGA